MLREHARLHTREQINEIEINMTNFIQSYALMMLQLELKLKKRGAWQAIVH